MAAEPWNPIIVSPHDAATGIHQVIQDAKSDEIAGPLFDKKSIRTWFSVSEPIPDSLYDYWVETELDSSFFEAVDSFFSLVRITGKYQPLSKKMDLIAEIPHALDACHFMFQTLQQYSMLLNGHRPGPVFFGVLLHDLMGKATHPKGRNIYYYGPKPEQIDLDLHVTGALALLDEIEKRERLVLPWELKEIIGNSHEKSDGSGYPFHRTGDPPYVAQLLQVVDKVVARAGGRPYHEHPIGLAEAYRLVLENAKYDLLNTKILDYIGRVVQRLAPEWRPITVQDISEDIGVTLVQS